MRILIAMAVHNTAENNRFQYTRKCIDDIINDEIHLNHDLWIVNNGSCEKTLNYIMTLPKQVNVIINPENRGTARAINQAWQNRKEGQHAIKMDDDVIINYSNWVNEMIEVVERMPEIGIVGLKRKDCRQTTWDSDPEYKSELIMLPHEPGQRWINVERTRDIMGTCTLFNSKLLDIIGYLYQVGLYGFDDVFASWRSNIAGFDNVHLSHIEIDHIDEGGTEYQAWKERSSHQDYEQTVKEVNEMLQGKKNIYIPFY